MNNVQHNTDVTNQPVTHLQRIKSSMLTFLLCQGLHYTEHQALGTSKLWLPFWYKTNSMEQRRSSEANSHLAR